MERYKDQNISRYQKNYINEHLYTWEELDKDLKSKLLTRLQEDGWLTWDFTYTIQKEEKEKYIKVVQALLILKQSYLNLPFKTPNPIESQKLLYEGDVKLSLIQIFSILDQFIFYDFLTIYINLLSTQKAKTFVIDINRYFKQLGINKKFLNGQLIPRQAKMIQDRIVEPTFCLLEDKKLKQVNNELREGLEFFNTQNYGNFILCSINSLVSALEFLTYGEITKNKRKFDKMITLLTREGKLSSKIKLLLKALNSYIEITRRDVTKAHTSYDKATEEEALFIFNLVMSIIQFLILSDNEG